MALPESIGQYRVVELLGRGGMGEVYKAVDSRMFGRVVAVKVLSAQLTQDPSSEQRFQREARTASTLQHPGIAIIHDRGEFEGRPYLVMEYLEGKDLSFMLQEKALDFEERLDIAAQVSAALAYAHEKGIVHRDIKPSNIMVVTQGGAPQAKLLDFGIAHIVHADSSMTLTQPGTTPYMSPEQISDVPVDIRSDLFCFGIVLYEMVTGVHPFSNKSPFVVTQRILTESPPAPRTIDPAIPAPLETLILQLLEKSPAQRPQSAGIVAQQLRRILKDYRSFRTSHPGVDSGNLEGMTSALLEKILGLCRSREDRGDLQEALDGYRRAAQIDPDSASLKKKISDLEAAIAASPARSEASPAVATQLLSDPSSPNRAEYIGRVMASAQEALETGAIDRASGILAEALRHYPDEGRAMEMLGRLMTINKQNIPYDAYHKAIVQGKAELERLDFEAARKAHSVASNLWPGDFEAVELGEAIDQREAAQRDVQEAMRRQLETLLADARTEIATAEREEERGLSGLDGAAAAAERARDLFGKASLLASSDAAIAEESKQAGVRATRLHRAVADRQKRRAEARASAEHARGLLREAARLAEGDEKKIARALDLLEEIRRSLENLATLTPEETSPKEILSAADALRESVKAKVAAFEASRLGEEAHRLLSEVEARLKASRERSHSTEIGVSASLKEAQDAVGLASRALESLPGDRRAEGLLRQAESLVREMNARLEALRSAREEEQRTTQDRVENVERRSKADAHVTKARQLRTEAESLGADADPERKPVLLEEAMAQLLSARELLPGDEAVGRELRGVEDLLRAATSQAEKARADRAPAAVPVEPKKAAARKGSGKGEEASAQPAGASKNRATKPVPEAEVRKSASAPSQVQASATATVRRSGSKVWIMAGAGVIVLAIVGFAIASAVKSSQHRALVGGQVERVSGLVAEVEKTASTSGSFGTLNQFSGPRSALEEARAEVGKLSEMNPQAASGPKSRLGDAEERLRTSEDALHKRLDVMLEQATDDFESATSLSQQPKSDRSAFDESIYSCESALREALAIDPGNVAATLLQSKVGDLKTSLAQSEEDAAAAIQEANKEMFGHAKTNIDNASAKLGSKTEAELDKGIDFLDVAANQLSRIKPPADSAKLSKMRASIVDLQSRLKSQIAELRKKPDTPPIVVKKEVIPPPPPPKPTTEALLAEINGITQEFNNTNVVTMAGARSRVRLADQALGKLKELPDSNQTRERIKDLKDRRIEAMAYLTMNVYIEKYNARDVAGVLAISRAESKEQLEEKFQDLKKDPQLKLSDLPEYMVSNGGRTIDFKIDWKDLSENVAKKTLHSLKKPKARLILEGDHYVIESLK